MTVFWAHQNFPTEQGKLFFFVRGNAEPSGLVTHVCDMTHSLNLWGKCDEFWSMLSGYLVCWKELLMSRQIMQIAHLLFVFSEGCQAGIDARNMFVFVWWLYLQWQAAPATGGTTSLSPMSVYCYEKLSLACRTKVSCGLISGSNWKTKVSSASWGCEDSTYATFLTQIYGVGFASEWRKSECPGLVCQLCTGRGSCCLYALPCTHSC